VLVGMTVAALLTEPWITLAVLSFGYLLLIPYGLYIYAGVRRRTPELVATEDVAATDGPDEGRTGPA